MPLQRVTRRSVPDDVFEQIVTDVVRGELTAGASLPSERRLAEVLGVSRPTVREALQRLAHAGLVEVRQGGATTVRDFRRHAGLELLPRLLLPEGELDLTVGRSILEARLFIGPHVAALAAERAGAALVPSLRQTVAALEADPDPVGRQKHALRFWEQVVDGADSITFRLMFNGLRAAYEPLLSALAPVMQAEVGRPRAYRAVAEAVAAGDPEAARSAAHDLLNPATTALLAAIRRLEEAKP
ncbi:MAG TPA: GntR family transcriptional regulator [Micromonosporaceae bacterium]